VSQVNSFSSGTGVTNPYSAKRLPYHHLPINNLSHHIHQA